MQTITIAKGDGIGPEIMEATLKVLDRAGADIQTEPIEIGEQVYQDGYTAGIRPEAWDSVRRNQVFLKAPITTPQGGGYKSLNVSTRKFLGLYANVRPCQSFDPFIRTKHPEMDLVVIRENEEDLYAGIEHQQTPEVAQCLKLITRPGCEKIITYAFEYARKTGRKKVTCFSKDNIMKRTDGLFHKVFDEIAEKYPDIESEHEIVDIASAKLADQPERYDVIVTPNLYGDIVSDISAQIAGSVGISGSANIGESCAMFEAIHGSAPDIAGKDMANPSGLINASVMMLLHIGQNEVAERIQNAWLRTIEEGIHTADIHDEGHSQKKVGTQDFAEAVAERTGKGPERLEPVSFGNGGEMKLHNYVRKPAPKKELLGVDAFFQWVGEDPDELARMLSRIAPAEIPLQMITNRGIKVWPGGFSETFCTDHWRCRFVSQNQEAIQPSRIVELLSNATAHRLEVIKTENLYAFDGERGFSLGQGQ
jgi:isocitrate dehydrogenase